MVNRLPPLHALRTFDAAARHLNLSRAAEELHVTHGAVSHQIKALEQALGVPLLRRVGRGMMLTEAGQRLSLHVRDALNRLWRGVEEVRHCASRERLVVSVLPAFAARWLVPRLIRFQQRSPTIDTVLITSLALTDFRDSDVDVAIRYGLGRWAGLQSQLLLREDVFPVCSPKYRQGRLPESAAEVAQCALLHDLQQPWEDWFRAHGVRPSASLVGPAYSESNLLLRAAVEGHGVALALGSHVERELALGELVKIQPGATTRYAYYIVHRRERALPAKVREFKRWLLEEARSPSTRPL